MSGTFQLIMLGSTAVPESGARSVFHPCIKAIGKDKYDILTCHVKMSISASWNNMISHLKN